MKRLNNKVALVTGAARGIGLATAELFLQEGARVIITDINDELGQAVANKYPENSEYLHLDVSSESDWQSVKNHIENKYQQLDILVNNAGITGALETTGPHTPENFDLESWHKVHAINLDGVALGCKYAIALMRKNKSASIVNISSRSGMVGFPQMAAYASSKAAVRNHTKSVALYCADKKYAIRCNSIHPGAILTPLWDAMLGTGEKREQAIEQVAAEVPLGKMGSPLDVAYAALYLASDESGYVTGTELTVDGGILAGSSASPKSR